MAESITSFMTADHQHCDHLFAKAEEAIEQQNPSLMEQFLVEMARHFRLEEDLLFGAFEEETGMHGSGPTEMMRIEHKQMRALMTQIEGAISVKDFEKVRRAGETLLILMQQHNLKEENMLYQMMDMHLNVPDVIKQLKELNH